MGGFAFLTPLSGLLAAGVVLPALLALYFLKLRRREMEVPSTLLWRKAVQDLQVNAPFQRLRRNLLLLLQLLALLALLLAFARPVVAHKPAAGKVMVVMIDRSASMSATDGNAGGDTRLSEAKRRAKDLVGTLDRDGRAMVIAFDDKPEVVAQLTADTAVLRTAIDSITPTDRPTKLRLAYQLAEAQTVAAMKTTAGQAAAAGGSQGVRPDVRLFSDGKILDPGDVSIRGDVRYEAIGSDQTPNMGIVAFSARRNYERPADVQVFVRVANYGPDTADADLQLTVDGRPAKVAGVRVMPERWDTQKRAAAEGAGTGRPAVDSAEFTIRLEEAALLRVELKRAAGDKDALAADDVATLVVPPPRPLGLALVSDGSNPFMGKVVRSLGLKSPAEIEPEAYEKAIPTKYDVIIFDNYRPKKLPPAGQFMYFGAVPEGLRLKAKTLQGTMVAVPGRQAVLDWRREHMIFRGLAMGKVFAEDAIDLIPAVETEVLVEGTKSPLVVLHREGRSTHLVVAFDSLASNWPTEVSWPVFMSNALQYLSVSSDLSVRESFAPGSTPRIPREALQQMGKGVSEVTLVSPDGSRRRLVVPVAGDFALPALDRVGLYTLEPAVPGFDRIAVNLLDGNESDIAPAATAPGGVGETETAVAGKARVELWWWLVACGAIPLLMIEWWVYTQRVHL